MLHTALQDLASAGAEHWPQSLLHNEGWLLRLLLDAFTRCEFAHPLAPAPGASWFSEAWLPTPFPPRRRGDGKGESWTRADGVVGHYRLGVRGRVDVSLAENAGQLVVIEAKLLSRLSASVTNAAGYDQAARTVACIAEVLHRAKRRPQRIPQLAFCLVVPQHLLTPDVQALLDKDAIRTRVSRRAERYGEKEIWLREWLEPTLEQMHIAALPWEELISDLAERRPEAGDVLCAFYQECLMVARGQRCPAPSTPLG